MKFTNCRFSTKNGHQQKKLHVHMHTVHVSGFGKNSLLTPPAILEGFAIVKIYLATEHMYMYVSSGDLFFTDRRTDGQTDKTPLAHAHGV